MGTAVPDTRTPAEVERDRQAAYAIAAAFQPPFPTYQPVVMQPMQQPVRMQTYCYQIGTGVSCY